MSHSTIELINFSQTCAESIDSCIKKIPLAERKAKGQFFTPISIADFMARQYIPPKDKETFHILDPGSGAGILTASFCDYIFSEKPEAIVNATLYENDKDIVSILRNNMAYIAENLEQGHTFNFKIINRDFIEDNYDAILKSKALFDFIVSNPPYYKIKKSSRYSVMMNQIVKGQPNVYFFFMAIAANLLNEGGQLTFITPRSFCSGDYFEKFRKWFLSKVWIKKIHIFGSRKEPFFNEVLQETVIISAGKKTNEDVTISHSNNSSFDSLQELNIKEKQIIGDEKEHYIIKIPISEKDVNIMNCMGRLPCRLSDLGLKISTGPVVDFRAKQHLSFIYEKTRQYIPLLWMHNLKNFHMCWPLKESKKPIVLLSAKQTQKLLRENRNYILLKRFTSKEQDRRLYAGIYFKHFIDSEYIAIENHLNYIWKPRGELNEDEVYGISALLNSSFYDRYFRIINGNTQVNASDIKNLLFPEMNEIISLGKTIKVPEKLDYNTIDNHVLAALSKYIKGKLRI